MHRCAVVPYEGTEPYIFVSYAHKDADQVYPIMEALYHRGYRIWYDDGIAPGSEWPENIAQHLSDSAIIVACVSSNSIASDNCRREVTFALSKRKAFLGIILEPTQMSLGMEMQLSAQQCIMKYGYSDQESFLRKVCSCPELAACLAQVPEAAAAEEATQTAATEILLEAEKPRKPAKAPKLPKVKKEKAPKVPRDPAKKVKRGKVLAIVAAALVVLIGAIAGIYAATHISIADESISKSETYLSFFKETISRDTVRMINKLKKLEQLNFDDCSFEKGALELLRPADTMRHIYITDCTGVSDVSWVTDLEQLQTLSLRNSGVDNELLPALPADLRVVNVSENPDITDLSVLKSCTQLTEVRFDGTGVASLEAIPLENLRTISFANTQVADIAPLERAQDLEYVDGSNTLVVSFSHLAPLQQLKEIRFNDCDISESLYSNTVFGSLRLQTLELANTRLMSLEFFANCTVLETVNLEGTPLSDIRVLEKSAATLKQLNLSHLAVSEGALQFLRECEGLTHVYLDGISMEDLSILANTTRLQELSAVGCGLKDIQGILQNQELTWIRLADNQITDISPLQCITGNWITLDLGYNPIGDISGLPVVHYDNLILVGTQVDPATASNLEGSCLVLSYAPALVEAGTAPEGFYDINVLDCPADKMVAVEDAIGAHRLTFLLSWQELLQKLEERGVDYSNLERG